MSAQDDYVKSQLDLLGEIQLSGLNSRNQKNLKKKIKDVKDTYDKARAAEKNDKLTTDERKQAKDVADAIAKAGVAFTKSTYSAVNSFQKGDAINGTADLMDMCASLATLVGSMSGIAGPIGAAIGALVSIIGTILRCCAPNKESELSKIEKLLNEVKAQTKLESIKAVHDEVLAYAITLNRQAESLQTLLAQPLHTHDDFRKFYVGLRETTIILGDNSPHNSVGMFKNWEVLEYLRNPKNQDLALWPTVLGIFCKTYSDLVSSTMTIAAMVYTDDRLERLKDVEPNSTGGLSNEDRRDLEMMILDLDAYGKARKLEYESCNALILGALPDLMRVAQQWGVYGMIGTNHALKFISGPKKLKSGEWNDVSDRNYYHQFMIRPEAAAVIHTGQPSSQFNFTPDYHCFVLKSTSSAYPGSHHWVDHLRLNGEKPTVQHSRKVLDSFSPAFTDLCIADEKEKVIEVVVGTGEVAGAKGSVTSFTLDAKDDDNTAMLKRINWWPQTTYAVGTVRAQYLPVSAIGDPDQSAIPPEGAAGIIYATMLGSTDIYVNTANTDHYLPGPPGWGTCKGIAVDDTYLWLYQSYGFAVVSHASVLSYLHNPLKSRQAPRWITYPRLPSEVLGDNLELGDTDDGAHFFSYNFLLLDRKPPLVGLRSLSPCEDGTLLAAVVHRTISTSPPSYVPSLLGGSAKYFIAEEETIQTATYKIDVVAGSVSVGKWTKIPGGALRVQKLPMPGWALLASLNKKLREEG